MGLKSTGSTLRDKISNREVIQRFEALLARMRRDATALPESERGQRMTRAENDEAYFLQTYMPHYFSAPFAEMHYALMAAAREPGVVIYRIPRGWGKSSEAQGLAIHAALFNKRRFQEFIGKSGDMGSELLMGILLELEENPRIRNDFGDVKSRIWSADSGYRLKNGSWLQQLGRGEPVRGRKKGEQRPDRIWADDIEDEQLVRNKQRVRELLKWWLRAVIPSLSENGTAIWLCTSLAQKSPSSLLLDPDWTLEPNENPPACKRLSFPARNSEGQSTWPAAWPDERLVAKEAEIGRTSFNQEFMHKPTPVGGMFNAAWFQFYNPGELPKLSELAIVTACDPSARSKSTSDHKAVITLAKHVPSGHYYVLYSFLRVATIPEMVEKMFLAQRNYRPITTRIETNAFAELLVYPIRDYEREHRGERLMYRTFESHGVAKETRVMQLQAPFERNLIHFMKGHSDQDTLMEQIELYGTGERDDGPDCLQMAYEFLRNMVTMPGYGKYHPGKRSAFSDEPLDSDWND